MTNGHYWFTDVVPGMYTLREVETPDDHIINGITPFPVEVTYGTVLVSELGLGMPYPGLQVEEVKTQLAFTNLIEASIHGIVVDPAQSVGCAGVQVELLGTGLSTTTDANGEFHFDGLDPNQFYIVEVDDEVSLIYVGSGEEYMAYSGQAALLDGQYEVVLGDLNDPSVAGDLVFSCTADIMAIPGDYDNDGRVGASDLALVLNHWGQDASHTGVPAGWVNMQPTGLIGSEHLSYVLNNWGAIQPSPIVNAEAPAAAGQDQQFLGKEDDRKEDDRRATSRLAVATPVGKMESSLYSELPEEDEEKEEKRLDCLDSFFSHLGA